MHILIFQTEPLNTAKSLLNHQEIEVTICTTELELSQQASKTFDLTFLITKKFQTIISVMEELVKRNHQIMVCTTPLTHSLKNRALNAGIKRILYPENWSPQAIDLRIYAALLEHQDHIQYGFCGGSPKMQNVYHRIKRFSKYNEHVLICGEPGTGKELCAAAIHNESSHEGPLIAVNCAAIKEELFESQLFGHERGSFSGATQKHDGYLIQANGGTLFLDELGEIPLTIQAKLLRALEYREVQPLGAKKTTRFNARVVMATNKDISDPKVFREDLYQRCHTFTIDLPPLRQKKCDIPYLAQHFVEEWNEKYSEKRSLPEEIVPFLLKFDWPGNVRELKNAIWGAAPFCDNDDDPISVLEIKKNIGTIEQEPETRNNPYSIDFDPDQDDWKTVENRAWLKYSSALLERSKTATEAIDKAAISRSTFYEKTKTAKGKLNS